MIRAPKRRANQVLRMISDKFGFSKDQLLDGQRGEAPLAEARQIAFYLLKEFARPRLTWGEIAAAFGRSRSDVRHGCKCIRERMNLYGGLRCDVGELASTFQGMILRKGKRS